MVFAFAAMLSRLCSGNCISAVDNQMAINNKRFINKKISPMSPPDINSNDIVAAASIP